jgi:Zn-dependent alcohol dehydrogenase
VVEPLIGGTWGLDGWNEAFRAMHEGRVVKSVLQASNVD